MTTPYTLKLADPLATLEIAGGKGASLARMFTAGLPVPDGFHVSTVAYRRYVDENGLNPRILDILAQVDLARPASLESVSQAIREHFAAGTIPADVAAAVVAAYEQLAGESPTVAVRSSATAEDLPEASFAGQQETYLNVRGADALLEAVKKCWASLWTARAIAYRARQGIAPEGVALAVVVQLLVPAEAAGILFTANPVTGDRSQAVISAAWGLGEAVVDGSVTPDAVTVDKASGQIVAREIADKPVMTVRVDGGTDEQPVPEPLRRRPALDDQAVAELVRLGAQIEQLYGMPMDVEWALADGQIAIVQARPITALPQHEPAPPTEWKLPDPKAWYARGSLCEHLPDPVSPLFATMGVRLANQSLGEMVGVLGSVDIDAEQLGYGYSVINGYLYLSTKLGLREMWGYLKLTINGLGMILRRGTERWQEGRATLQGAASRWAARDVATLAPGELLAGSRELLLEAMRFYTVIQTGTLPSATSSETVFKQAYKLVSRKDDPDPTAFLFGFDTVPIQAEKSLYDLAMRAAGEPDLRAYLLETPSQDLVTHLRNAHAPAGVRSEVWSAWRDRFRAHLDAYGDTVYEYDLLNPTPTEAPEPLLEAVRMYLDGKGKNPHERQQEAIQRREQATAQVLARARWPFKNLFSKALGWAQRTGPVREDSLADMGMAHPKIRRLLGELGRRFVTAGAIAESDDIYWLHEQEIEQLAEQLESGAPLPAMQGPVAERKRTYESQRRLVAPAILPETSRLAKIMPWSEQRQGEEHLLKGTGTSTGKVTAPACVLFGPEDFASMKPGDVLVAVTTTPAWTPLFAMASAVVTDIGGPLSHSSIVAREYGIPAVMATGLATRRIHSGQVITVDGGAGIVLLSNGHAEGNS
jgi:pyruvate,water dikinase